MPTQLVVTIFSAKHVQQVDRALSGIIAGLELFVVEVCAGMYASVEFFLLNENFLGSQK